MKFLIARMSKKKEIPRRSSERPNEALGFSYDLYFVLILIHLECCRVGTAPLCSHCRHRWRWEQWVFAHGEWTRIPFILKAQWDDDKNEVEKEHRQSHALGHLPIKDENWKEDQQQHCEENDDGAYHSLGRHRNRLQRKHHRVEEPGSW